MSNNLLAKWLPRKAKSYESRKLKNDIMVEMNISPKQYRHLIANLTKVVETKMCKNEWSDIIYSHVPSMAFSKYSAAFLRNDNDRFTNFIDDVKKGKEKINAGAIFPHNIILNLHNNEAAEQQWNNLPNYLENNNENLLPIIDVSGSMLSIVNGTNNLTCMTVAIALGIYVAERSNGIFKNNFITFHENPQLINIFGNLYDKVRIVRNSKWGYNTDLQKVFDLILKTAIKYKIHQSEMPSKIIIFSDMEFDKCDSGATNFQEIKFKYKNAGYKRPDIIFWNLNARNNNYPVKFDQNKTAMISGFSPSIMKNVLSNNLDKMTPYNLMLDVIMNERYNLS